MSDITLVVMAAGIGSRFGGLKQIEPIGAHGEVTITYSMYDALRAGVTRIVFIIRKEIEDEFRVRVGKFAEARTDTVYVMQALDGLPPGFSVPAGRQKPWGTGQAILACKDAVKTPFIVINADDLYGPTAYDSLMEYLSGVQARGGRRDYCMPGYVLGNTLSPHGHVARGICEVTPDGYLRDIAERTRIEIRDGSIQYANETGGWTTLPAESIASMNMFGFTPDIFDELEPRFATFLKTNAANLKAEFYIPVVVGDLAKEDKARVKVLKTDDSWYGVTYREDLPGVRKAVQDMVRKGMYPERLC